MPTLALLRLRPRRWLNTNVSCPVCRKPLDGDDDQQPPPGDDGRRQPPPTHQSGPPQDGNAAGRWNGDLLTAELAFRLAMLQQQYPQYISDDMVHDWSHQAEQVRSGVGVALTIQRVCAITHDSSNHPAAA